MAEIRVLLVDDHTIMRHGLRSLLENHDGIAVVAEAENGRKALQLAQETLPDVVVMDISMPDMNGVEATRQLLAARPHLKVIALSMHSDKRFVLGMLKAGAAGYLLKDCASEELAAAITTVAGGKNYLSADITGIVIDGLYRPAGQEAGKTADLSSREREVLQLIAEGWSTKQIAAHLFVSVKTIETHRRQIMNKLNSHSVADLTKFAIREGLTSIDS